MTHTPSPVATITVYHPVTGRPVGTVPADDHESVQKLRARVQRNQTKLEMRLGYSIRDMDPGSTA